MHAFILQEDQEQAKCISKETDLTDSDRSTEQVEQLSGQEPARQDSDASSDTSSGNSDNPNRFTDGELTDIARAGKEGTPPCSHRGACEKRLICPFCKEAYCMHQSEFFTRHKMRCRGVLATTGESESGTKCIIIIMIIII